MNAEGIALLRQLIKVTGGMDVFVQSGDCKSIAILINGWLIGAEVSSADVYAAIKNRVDFGGPKMNVEILRARIDAMGALYSARINASLPGEAGAGALQAILNEVVREAHEVTMDDVKAAMGLRAVSKPTRVAQGAVALVGTARIG